MMSIKYTLINVMKLVEYVNVKGGKRLCKKTIFQFILKKSTLSKFRLVKESKEMNVRIDEKNNRYIVESEGTSRWWYFPRENFDFLTFADGLAKFRCKRDFEGSNYGIPKLYSPGMIVGINSFMELVEF